MAIKKARKNSDKSTLDILKNKVSSLNTVALETSSEIVDETLATGEKWQNLFAKSLKKGTILIGRQQDMMFDGLEMLKGHYGYGNKRLKNLLSLGVPKKKTKTKKSTVKRKAKKSIDDLMEATIKAEKAGKKVGRPGPAKKATNAKATKTRAAAAKPKVAPAKKTKPVNLTVIEGIGPKIKELLNKAGINTFEQLAAAKPAELKRILVDAGTRFQMHDPSTWAAQAKLAAAGKMDELKVLQTELKGGK